MNKLSSIIDFLARNKIDKSSISSSTTSTSTSTVANSAAVKAAMDKANSAFTSASGKMAISGGTFTGITKAHSNTSYTSPQIRSITYSTSDPSGGSNGDMWIKYK